MPKQAFILAFGVIIYLLVFNPGGAEASQGDLGYNPLTLPVYTPVKLVLHEGLNSQRNQEGDEITFSVAEDVIIMDRTYLCAGTPVIGRITNVKPAKSWGRQGTMDVEILSVAPLYSGPIPLTFEIETEGGSEKATSIGVSALALIIIAPVAILGGGAVSGKSAKIEAGSQLTVLTRQEAGIKNISVDKMREQSEEWFEELIIRNFLNYKWDDNQTVQEGFDSIAHPIDESNITLKEAENFKYIVLVQVTEDRVAEFKFQPFEEAHIGKFITLEPRNELAENIMRIIPEEE